MFTRRLSSNLAKPDAAFNPSVNWGHPLWWRTRGMWLFNIPYANSNAVNLVNNSGIFRTDGNVSFANSRIGRGMNMDATARMALNQLKGVQVQGSPGARYGLAQGGGVMPTDSVTIVLIRRKSARTAGTFGPIGLEDSTTGRRCGCNMADNGVFNWQFGDQTVNNLFAQGAWMPQANTHYTSFSTITLAANSSLGGWYWLDGATNNYNPIWGKDGSNEIYFGSGASAGKVAVVKAGATIAQSTGTVSQTQWQHLLITDNGSAITIYLNGADIGNSVGYTTMAGMDLTRLNQGVNANNFVGRMCQQAIWSAALSSGNATTLYGGGYGIAGDTSTAPFNSNLVALWADGTTTDASGNGHTLTANNGIPTGTGRTGKDFDAMNTDLQYLVYTAGRRGMAIYADGRRIGYSSTAVTRTDADSDFLLNENANSNGEAQDIFFAAVLDTEWTQDQVAWWYQDPWSGVAPLQKVFTVTGQADMPQQFYSGRGGRLNLRRRIA
jgi:hypothetical protein